MRVLVVDGAGQLWGSERALLDLIDSAKGLTFCVCCPPKTPLVTELEKRGIAIQPYFIANLHIKSRFLRLKASLGVLRACLKFRPDVIHINQGGAYRVVLPAAKLLALPIVCHVRIFEDAEYLARCAPDSHRLKGLIAISESVEDELRSFDALRDIPVHRIYDAYSSTLKTEPSVERLSNRIACVGRIEPIKGHALLVKAMELQPLAARAECWIIGDGSRDYMEKLKRASSPNIKWCGFIHNVVEELRSCTVLVCPSYREPLGRVILEAWDAGAVPVVFGGAGGAAEIVRDADGGLVYHDQSPEALASVLASALMLDPTEVTRLINNGRAWSAKNCAPHVYGSAVAAVFSKSIVI